MWSHTHTHTHTHVIYYRRYLFIGEGCLIKTTFDFRISNMLGCYLYCVTCLSNALISTFLGTKRDCLMYTDSLSGKVQFVFQIGKAAWITLSKIWKESKRGTYGWIFVSYSVVMWCMRWTLKLNVITHTHTHYYSRQYLVIGEGCLIKTTFDFRLSNMLGCYLYCVTCLSNALKITYQCLLWNNVQCEINMVQIV